MIGPELQVKEYRACLSLVVYWKFLSGVMFVFSLRLFLLISLRLIVWLF